MSDAFDVIPYEDIKGNWKKLGSGSFGNVYKGTYLGIDVAIKEVLPSTEYDVGKYFEREWRLMKECRHPNICLFIGLSRAPPPDNRIFIISEFIENGNVRLYIHDKTKPFPWKLRISFATDVARALAYLHARKCIHRDLKGENLLVTANGRLKVTDFGFARIAARNEEESKRLTFCGTDSYMSPEILIGYEFDLPTDVFSLGIIFCEIGARKLADDHTFKRTAPSFGLDEEEVRKLMSPGCPKDFLQLCLDCCNVHPSERPTTREILERLRVIEAEVLSRPEEGDTMHLGSVRFMSGTKRPGAAPRIPSFGMGVGKDIRGGTSSASEEESDDEDLMEAVSALSHVGLKSDLSEGSLSKERLLNRAGADSGSPYSTTVVKSQTHSAIPSIPPSLSSILTIRPSPDPNASTTPVVPGSPSSATASSVNPGTTSSSILNSTPTVMSIVPPSSMNLGVRGAFGQGNAYNGHRIPTPTQEQIDDAIQGEGSIVSIASLDSYHTATTPSSISGSSNSNISTAYATEGGSTIRSLHGNWVGPLFHRFTLIKPGTKQQKRNSTSGSGPAAGGSGSASPNHKDNHLVNSTSEGVHAGMGVGLGLSSATGWNPLDFFFSSALLLNNKCDLCGKRLGWKPLLECDDCGIRTHVKCGELAPLNCGLEPRQPHHPHHQAQPQPSASTNPLSAISPLSKVRQGAALAGEQLTRIKSASPARR